MHPPAEPLPSGVPLARSEPGVSWRLYLYELLEDEERPLPLSRWLHALIVFVIVVSVGLVVLDTEPDLHRRWGTGLLYVEHLCAFAFTIEYVVRVWVAVEDRAGRYDQPLWGRLRYMATPMAVIDLMAILPTYLSLLMPADFLLLRTLRLVRILKITRYSPALATVEIVLYNERRSLAAAATIMGIAILLAAGALHVVEGRVQPEAFGSIPAALWWAVVTLTTLGYGDVTPVTSLGRVIGGLFAILGILMFALPTAILGAGFTQELHKRNFITTAAMVARVPMFRDLPPPQLAELTALLKPRMLPPRYTVLRRGEHPDSMYFIDEGRVILRYLDRRIVLAAGSFFGESALLGSRKRHATIITLSACKLLELPAGDFHRLIAGDSMLRHTIIDSLRREGAETQEAARAEQRTDHRVHG